MDAAISLAEPYATRSVRCLDLLMFDGWRLKLYGIAYRRERPVQALVDAAVAATQEWLPRPRSVTIAMAWGSSARTTAGARTFSWSVPPLSCPTSDVSRRRSATSRISADIVPPTASA